MEMNPADLHLFLDGSDLPNNSLEESGGEGGLEGKLLGDKNKPEVIR